MSGSAKKSDGSRWTSSEIEYLARLYVDGKTPAEIAQALDGRSTKAIINQLHDAALLGKNPIKTNTGKRIATAVAELRATRQAAVAPTNHRAAWDIAADNVLLSGFAADATPAELAKICGRTASAVAGRLHSLGFLIFDKVEKAFKTAPRVWLKV